MLPKTRALTVKGGRSKFINWICNKFGIGESKELVKHFENDTNTFIDPVKQLKHEEREKEWDLEM